MRQCNALPLRSNHVGNHPCLTDSYSNGPIGTFASTSDSRVHDDKI